MSDPGKHILKDIERVSNIPSVNHILELACETTGMGFAAIARVDEFSWVACATLDKIGFGLHAGGELKLETTICNEIMQHRQVVVIDQVDQDPLYKDHHTPKIYGLQSYISVPIILKNGSFFGTLCAIDRVPAKVNNPKVVNTLKLFAELIGFHLDSQEQLADRDRTIAKERSEAELREQFIAMLGHDLRNPVSAISSAVQLQLKGNLDERNQRLAQIISDAAVRTRGLIDNILDFASGKLGSGIVLNYDNHLSLEETIEQVITELKMAWPDIIINKNITYTDIPVVDNKRIAQLISNILSNAITHGSKGKPIAIDFTQQEKGYLIKISNDGTPIPKNILPHLFKPFSRGKVQPGQQGLGLGLYIASEIARAHGGFISVSSINERTCFEVKLPG
ncbi:histidine kinase [Pedobacter kyungheensis]|uniref:histidine kinase n=1 Tax=Pedobacter kyungheensis TaxID=1069985 RepID=A0A0C1DC76_9SPHI|nr:GAF domain-containing sensor histidine kinase [Pedobacter kyungheensis]KIA95181.1 histidine kinase [Pedobacter kyungheensis]